MSHLQDEEMVGLVFGELDEDERDSCLPHLRSCPDCTAAVDRLSRAVALLEKRPMEPAPPFAWTRIKSRIERSGASQDWSEPAWLPLILGNVAGIVLIISLISVGGMLLESASVWRVVRAWPLAREIGPRNLAALVFFGMGALVTLALTPILWWESRHPRKGIMK